MFLFKETINICGNTLFENTVRAEGLSIIVPTLVNAFLVYFEKYWLRNGPSEL